MAKQHATDVAFPGPKREIGNVQICTDDDRCSCNNGRRAGPLEHDRCRRRSAGRERCSDETSDGGTITPPGAAVEDKKICKALPSSYSRMSKRACLTKNEWKQVEEDVQNDNGF